MKHHHQCAAANGSLRCSRATPCATVQEAIDAFNADDGKTHRSNPDSREHYRARWPILADDCDYEVVGFSGVQGRWVELDLHAQAMQSKEAY